MKVLYTAEATAKGGRNGVVESSDGSFKLQLAMPTEMGGTGKGANPEQLFAAGYAACFEGALGVVAKRQNVEIKDCSIIGKVGIGAIEGGGFGLAVELVVSLPGLSSKQAHELVEAAHRVCPYSNATRNNIDVKLTIAEPARV
jgi:Ohr subfamily peroxiredoxin